MAESAEHIIKFAIHLENAGLSRFNLTITGYWRSFSTVHLTLPLWALLVGSY